MPTRSAWILLLAVCLGCDCLLPLTPTPDGGAAQRLWQKGQEALLDGRTDEGIALYQQSLAADPTLTRNHLSLAAAYMEKGDPEQACIHLQLYVTATPGHVLAHAHLAELLLRLNRPDEAREEFEHYLAGAQEGPASVSAEVVHCHSRLVDLAETVGDPYGEHLHRGIGLYLLAEERAGLPGLEGDFSRESLLFRAAAELTQAQRQRPDEARPPWYLYQVWAELAQHDQARRWLGRADAAAPFSYLTPTERRDLELARSDAHR